MEYYDIKINKDDHDVRSDILSEIINNYVDSLKAIGYRVNALESVDYYVVAYEQGSFVVRLKAVYGKTNKFASDNVIGIILFGVLVNFIYDFIKTEKSPQIIINTHEAIIEIEGQKIIVPRKVVELHEKIKDVPSIKKSLKLVFKGVQQDDKARSLGLSYNDGNNIKLTLDIPSSEFDKLAKDDEIIKRQVVNDVDLIITRAILERSRRRWEFNLNGKRISCPIVLDDFYKKFESHLYEIAPGDKLRVRLLVDQSFDSEINSWVDDEYHINDVFDLIKNNRTSVGIQQTL
jgi:hypothetical protein